MTRHMRAGEDFWLLKGILANRSRILLTRLPLSVSDQSTQHVSFHYVSADPTCQLKGSQILGHRCSGLGLCPIGHPLSFGQRSQR